MLRSLLRPYWQLTLFKQHPADTPYSPQLLIISGLCYFIVILSQWLIAEKNKPLEGINIILLVCALLATYLVYTYILLGLFRLSNRYVQTTTCLFAGHTIIHLCAFPLLFLSPLLAHSQSMKFISAFIAIIYLIFTLAISIWQFMLSIFVYKHALSVDYLAAILASLGLMACNILVVSFLH